MLWTAFLLATPILSVMSSKWVSVNYLDSDTCKNAPSSIIGYSTADILSNEPGEGEVWPIFPIVFNGYRRRCGFMPMAELDGLCCYSIIDHPDTVGLIDYMYGIKSALYLPVLDYKDYTYAVPKFKTPAKYCKAESSINETAIFGLFMIVNNGLCMEDYFLCTTSGILRSFPKAGCKGVPVNYTLTSTASMIFDDNLGSVMVSFVESSVSNGKIAWTAYMPQYVLVPSNKNAAEILLTLLLVLSFIFVMYPMAFWGVRFYKKRSIQSLISLVSLLFLLAYLIAFSVYTYTYYPDDPSFFTARASNEWTINFAILTSMLNTTKFISLIEKWSNRITILVYVGVVLINFALAGGNYLSYFSELNDLKGNQAVEFGRFITDWLGLLKYYLIIHFCYAVIPIYIIILKTARASKISGGFISFITRDKTLLLLTALQPFTIIWFYAIELLKNPTVISDDRTFYAMTGYKAFFLSSDCVLNCIIIDRLFKLINNQPKQSELSESTKKSTL